MILRGLVIVLASGCGRIAFDDLEPDAVVPAVCVTAVGHDEDADAIDDACDVCPHVSDPMQADEDLDGVGDVCDPRVTVAGDRIVQFDPFVSPALAWSFFGNVTYGTDQMLMDARNTLLIAGMPWSVGADSFSIGGQIGAAAGPQRQITLTGRSPSGFYYCEIDGDDGSSKLAFTYTLDGAIFTVVDGAAAQILIENRAFTLTLTELPNDVTCQSSWPVDRQPVLGARPAITPDNIEITVQGVELALDYFVQIRSN